jgi:hypothetical protein
MQIETPVLHIYSRNTALPYKKMRFMRGRLSYLSYIGEATARELARIAQLVGSSGLKALPPRSKQPEAMLIHSQPTPPKHMT